MYQSIVIQSIIFTGNRVHNLDLEWNRIVLVKRIICFQNKSYLKWYITIDSTNCKSFDYVMSATKSFINLGLISYKILEFKTGFICLENS